MRRTVIFGCGHQEDPAEVGQLGHEHRSFSALPPAKNTRSLLAHAQGEFGRRVSDVLNVLAEPGRKRSSCLLSFAEAELD